MVKVRHCYLPYILMSCNFFKRIGETLFKFLGTPGIIVTWAQYWLRPWRFANCGDTNEPLERYIVGTRKSKTSPSAEPVWAQLKGHAGTDTGMQARQPGTETRVIFQPNTALTLQRQTWRTKATTRRLFRGRSCVVHGAVRRKSERTALSRETFLPSFARRYTRCNVKTCSLQIMNPDIWVF